jgi:hypothetical protein
MSLYKVYFSLNATNLIEAEHSLEAEYQIQKKIEPLLKEISQLTESTITFHVDDSDLISSPPQDFSSFDYGGREYMDEPFDFEEEDY